MDGECYFCHGLVLPEEADDIVLSDHDDHRVFMHRQCADGYDAIADGGTDGLSVRCPECGEVEVV